MVGNLTSSGASASGGSDGRDGGDIDIQTADDNGTADTITINGDLTADGSDASGNNNGGDAGSINIVSGNRTNGEDWVAFMNCVGMGCLRGRADNFFRGKDWSEIYSAVTGVETSLEELRNAARRVYDLYKALNVRMGFSRKDDVFPERWFEPLKTDDRGTMVLCDYLGTPLSRQDCEKLLDDYYDERGWDIRTGIPTEKGLLERDLADVAKDLNSRGFIK